MPTHVSTSRSRPPPAAPRWPEAGRPLGGRGVEGRQPDELSFGHRLNRRRQALGWTLERLAYEMRLVADGYGIPIANTKTLVPKLSRWQHDERPPGQRNLHVLAEALGVPVAELGLPVDPDFPWPPRRQVAAEKTGPTGDHDAPAGS